VLNADSVLNVNSYGTIDVKKSKISHATLVRIKYFPLLLFDQLKISKSIATFHWRIVSSIRISLSSTQPSDIRIRYGSDISALTFRYEYGYTNLQIRIRIRILMDMKKWYPYPGWRQIQIRISADNPHLMAPYCRPKQEIVIYCNCLWVNFHIGIDFEKTCRWITSE